MSELTLTVIRLGLLALLWIFIFSVVGVLRGDLYGTRVVSRSAKKSGRGDNRGLTPATPPQPMLMNRCCASSPRTAATAARNGLVSASLGAPWFVVVQNRYPDPQTPVAFR